MVKAEIKSKGKLMELEGDMILGTTVLYDAIGNSEAFIVGDVKRSILPGVLAGTTVALLKGHFSGAGKSVCEFPYSTSGSYGSNMGGGFQ